jgi:hypothetical protein
LAAVFLNSEDGKKTVGWIVITVLAPFILIVAVLCSLGSGEAEHNTNTVEACFYGIELGDNSPDEYKNHIAEMRQAFALLDSAVAGVNSQTENGSLDPIMVKAVFMALCFGEDAPTRRAANRFVDCFYSETTLTKLVEQENEDGEITMVEEQYTKLSPLSLDAAYNKAAALLGRSISQEDRDNVSHIYSMIAGNMGDVTYDGEYSVSGSFTADMDELVLNNAYGKNADDLVSFVIYAYESGWGYVWGTFGNVLTEDAFASKLAQYPEGVGNYADFIRTNWLGRRTVDCAGLIKSYCWYDPVTDKITYASNGMPDMGANQLYYAAAESGTIDTMPDIPGIAVWHNDHIGVYIGGGEVIEAMGTRYGVVKTQLTGSSWTHWLKIPYIQY